MKVAVIFSCALFANAVGLWLHPPKANWPSVQEHIVDLEALVLVTMTSIYNDALSDNEVVGATIGKKVSDAAEDASDLLSIVTVEVDAHTLNSWTAREHLGELLVIFTDLYADIETELLQLSASAQRRIDADFTNLFLTIPSISNKVYAALEEPDTITCGLVGFNFTDTVEPPEPVDVNTPPGTEIWETPIYSVAYAAIVFHPHNKYLDQVIANNTLQFETTSDFPNFVEDTNLTIIHRVLQFSCVDGTTVTYQFDFSVEDGPIVEPTLSPKY